MTDDERKRIEFAPVRLAGSVVPPSSGADMSGFQVRLEYEMDDDWKEKDDRIKTAAGRYSDFSGAGRGGHRDHGWNVATFDDAVALKQRLEEVPDVKVAIREK